ncbi:MAG: DUF1573 domain-containing protein [Muribaculaceae bacterium]|nr:DUF1573 domain-containing protein [Muribaculaceae bacterium]
MKKPSFFAKLSVIPALLGCAMLSAMAPTAYSQIEKSLRFIPENVDFGVINEEDGKVKRTVKAVNISQDSTFIISARTSCGCSAAEYPDDVLAPGDTAIVTLTYDPVNRPGKFLKTAKFFTGKERIGNSIKLSGTVIPSQKNLDRVYPDKAGRLRLSSAFINAGEVSRQEARPLFVGIYNDSDRQIALSAETDSYPLEAGITPDTIEPFGVATLTLMLKGRNIAGKENEFMFKAFLIETESGDTITSIPVGGYVKTN